MRFFFFGTLMDQDVMAAVTGRSADHHQRRPAWLDGYRAVKVARETFPMLVAAPGARLDGLLVEGIETADLDRILYFESVEYDHRPVEVTLADGTDLVAQAFLSSTRARTDDQLWSFSDWQRRHKAQCLREAAIWMALYGHVDIHEADRLWDEAQASGEPLDRMVERVRRGLHRSRRQDTAESA